MSEANQITGIDFNELARLISRELDCALQISELSMEWAAKLHIASVRVKLGQQIPPLKPPDKKDEETAAADEDDVKPFLLLDRYPPSKNGWIFELEFSSGPAPPRVRGIDGLWITIPHQKLPTTADLFGPMPTTVLKGVSRRWSEKLKEINVSTVADLITVKQSDVDEMIKKTDSYHPVELRQKAQLLNVVIPEIPASPANHCSLFSLVGKSPYAIRKLIGVQKFSATASEQLFSILSLLFTTIDQRVLKQIFIKDLREMTQTS